VLRHPLVHPLALPRVDLFFTCHSASHLLSFPFPSLLGYFSFGKKTSLSGKFSFAIDLHPQIVYHGLKVRHDEDTTMKRFTATANDEGVRLSRFVQSVTTGLPTSLLYKSFRNKRIEVNGKKAAPDARLCAGDLIELYINDEFFPPEAAPARPAKPSRPKQPRVQVVYEDGNIAVLYKPA